MGYPAYQCFKTVGRDVYCSSTIVKNHDIGAEWVRSALDHFELAGNDIHGKPYTSDSQPDGATIFPDDEN